MISPSLHSISLKSVFYKINLENPSTIKISSIWPHILVKQKGSEDETIEKTWSPFEEILKADELFTLL